MYPQGQPGGGEGGGGDRVGRGKRTRGKKFDKTLITMDQKRDWTGSVILKGFRRQTYFEKYRFFQI